MLTVDMKLSLKPCVERYLFLSLFLLGLALLLALALGSGEAEGKTLYVDDDAGEEGDGSLERPFLKIQDGVNASKDRDILRIFEGVYSEDVVVNRSVSLIGNGSTKSIIAWKNYVNNDSITILDVLADNVVIQGFSIRQHLYAGIGIKVLGRYTSISDTNVTECEYGIFIYGSDNNTIEKNNVSHCSEAGIRVTGVNNTVVNNTLYRNVDGIRLQGSEDNPCQHNLVLENNCTWDISSGIKLDTSSSNEIRGNNCSFGGVSGIEVAHSDECVVLENTFYQYLQGVTLYNSTNIYFSFNNITENEEGIHAKVGGTGNTFRFNRIYSNYRRGVSEITHEDYTLDARYNYWGSDSGPYYPRMDHIGEGDEIINRVKFSPWLDEKGGKHYSEEENRMIENSVVTYSTVIAVLLSLAIIISEPLRYAFLTLYTRLSPDRIESDIARQNTRGQIYRFIKEQPGINLSSIKEESKLGYGTVVYHLSVLQREGYLRSATAGRRKQFWTKRDFPGLEETSLTETQQTILEALKEKGKMTRKELQEKTGIPKSTLGNNIRELVKAGKMEEEETGEGGSLCSLKLY